MLRLPLVYLLLLGLPPIFLPAAARAQLPDHPRVRQTPIPGWARDLEVDPGATLDVADADVSHLLVDYQARVPRRGEPARFYRQAYRIESRGALEDWSSWEISFEPTYQQVRVHHLRIHRDGTWSDRLATSRAQVLHREEDRSRQQLAKAADAGRGSVDPLSSRDPGGYHRQPAR